jgi:pyruvate, water dikinase
MPSKKKRKKDYILWFKDIRISDVDVVGGKNASLGEMYTHLTKKGVRVPNGFAVTATAYQQFLRANKLDSLIKKVLTDADLDSVKVLRKAGKTIRTAMKKAILPDDIRDAVRNAYKTLGKQKNCAVAVRSSATAEDLPNASFAGQQETYLNVVGQRDVVDAVKKCMISLFTDRAISYRHRLGFDHLHVSLSACVQQMIDASDGSAGVMFTVDTESGFENVVLINAAYGLGEYVVKGRVTPDQYYVFKPTMRKGKAAIISRSLGKKNEKLITGKNKGTKRATVSKKDQSRFAISDDDVMALARWADSIEKYYKRPQDIEWVKDGKTGKLYIVQSRPETVQARTDRAVLRSYHLKKRSAVLLEGIAVGQRIGAGRVRIIEKFSQMSEFKNGDVLVTRITDPDWEPIMKKASAIVTEQGGKTSHAAIVSRELGVPCIVGAADARKKLKKGQKVTVSCATGHTGHVYKGILPFEIKETRVKEIPKTKTKIMMNVGDPDNAFSLAHIPHDGIGLARLEFIFSNYIRIHPLALLHYAKVKSKKEREIIRNATRGYTKKSDFCVDKLAEGVGRIAAASYPRPVVVRTSDFKTNEYATLVGGSSFEPKEENPMMGWRGASRYYSKEYKAAFALECAAIKKVREQWGLDNVIVMIPFCRTPEEGKKVLGVMKKNGLEKGKNGLKVYVMCEIPSNVVLADQFAELFDGFSIGSNDLVQLTLGLDRDTTRMGDIGNPNNDAVKRLIHDVIKTAHAKGKPVGICGQAPSDYAQFASFLVQEGIDSISLNPDTVLKTRRQVAKQEKTIGRTGKKTHKTSLSAVVAFGLLAAGIISLGSGCASTLPAKDIGDATYTSPAEIRQRAMRQVEIAVAEKENEYNNEYTQYTQKEFAGFEIDYPVRWRIEHWERGVLFQQGDGGEFVSVYAPLITPPLTGDSQAMSVDGQLARRYDDIAMQNGTTSTVVVVPQGDETTIIIESNSPRFDYMLSSFVFLEESQETPDRPLTHWDVREKRLCAQVITMARPSDEGQCDAFPTPCDVPDEWQICE